MYSQSIRCVGLHLLLVCIALLSGCYTDMKSPVYENEETLEVVVSSCREDALIRASYLFDDSDDRGRILVEWENLLFDEETYGQVTLTLYGDVEESFEIDAADGEYWTDIRIQQGQTQSKVIGMTLAVSFDCDGQTTEINKSMQFLNPIEYCPTANIDDIEENPAEFYECAERWLNEGEGCGIEGYPQGYGAKYANRFYFDTRPKMSERGVVWLDNTLVCLQEELKPRIASDTSCDIVRKEAFNTHPYCYAYSGICERLNLIDLLNIANTIDGADLFSKDGKQQVINMIPQCLAVWAGITDTVQ